MKALSLHEPWATLMRLGVKQYETRDWTTRYRGPVAIHSTQNRDHKHVFDQFADVLVPAGYLTFSSLPFGCVLAVGELVAIYHTENIKVSDEERRYGDFSEGRAAWKFENMLRVEHPVPWRGQTKLWNLYVEFLTCSRCAQLTSELVGDELCSKCWAEN